MKSLLFLLRKQQRKGIISRGTFLNLKLVNYQTGKLPVYVFGYRTK